MGETVTHSVRYQVTKTGLVKTSNTSTTSSIATSAKMNATAVDDSKRESLSKNKTSTPDANRNALIRRLFKKTSKHKLRKDENDNDTSEANEIPTNEIKQNAVLNRGNDSMRLVNQIVTKDYQSQNASVNVYELIRENNHILKELKRKGLKGDLICPDVVLPLHMIVREVVSPLSQSENIFAAARKLGLHSFIKLTKAAGLLESLSSRGRLFTLFAPTDEAFRSLPKEKQQQLEDTKSLSNILLYHMVDGNVSRDHLDSGLLETLNTSRKIRTSRLGGTISVQGASVITPNIYGSDGILHSINTVLIPPTENLQELMYREKRLSTFLSLIQETDLMYLFNGTSAYTVFAPANEAFQKFPTEELLKLRQSKRLLKAVLLYHIYGPGTLYANNFQLGSIYRLRMLIRPSVVLQLRRKSGSEHLHLSQGCKTIDTDVIASNGVIHIVDTILLPFGRDI